MGDVSGEASPRISFIPGSAGDLFAIYHPPLKSNVKRLDVVVIPPFAEEMNKSRRMVTLLAQRLSDIGIGTLVFDLYGTGDSQGDFSQARWEIWRQDVATMVNWLRNDGADQVHVLGFRLGALLALDAHSQGDACFDGMMFWAPVISGQVAMTQFLRLRLAASMMGEDREKETTKSLKTLFEAGETVEIAGYELAPELFRSINELRLESLMDKGTPLVNWIELVSEEGRSFSPASQRVVDSNVNKSVQLNTHVVVGDPFWSLQEITVVPELLDKTTSLFAKF